MRHLTLRERDSVSIGPNCQISELEAEGIEKLTKRLPLGVVGWGHRSLKIGPFCGVLQTEQLSIEILPKIDYGDDSHQEMRGLLVAMLARAGELSTNQVGDASIGFQKMHLLDIFIEDFCNQVKSALRGGAIARYAERIENLHAIRGRLELTAHLRANVFDHSRLLCRFDEHTVDNPYNQALKGVIRVLLGFARSPRTRAMVASFLHRFDQVNDRRITTREIDGLRLDRTIRHWEPVFARARWLLAGLFPDVRTGDVTGSALMFNMERLFESLVGLSIRQACHSRKVSHLTARLQSPIQNLASSGFQLRPDISILSHEKVVAIVDAKWKRLLVTEANSGVTSSDAYQMNAYASRYRCEDLALVYPASTNCPPGTVREFEFMTISQPRLKVITLDVRELAFSERLPDGLLALVEIAAQKDQALPEFVVKGPKAH